MSATKQEFVYVLKLDDSNVATGIKRVSKELVDIDKSMQVLLTELKKADANQLVKSVGEANTATTTQVKAVKDLNAELDKSASYAAKSKSAFNIAGDVEKQLNDLKKLQQAFLETTKFPANAQEFWKAPLANARKFKQEADFTKLINDANKYLDTMLKLAVAYDNLANKQPSSFVQGVKLAEARAAQQQAAKAAAQQLFQNQFSAFSQLSNQVNLSPQLAQLNLVNSINSLRAANTAAQQAANAQQTLQQALVTTAQQASKYHQAFIAIQAVLVDFRMGLNQAQRATLSMARLIQQEIADRAKLKAEYAKLTPEMLKLIDIRQREKQLVKEIDSEYSKYLQAHAAAMKDGDLAGAMAVTNAWNTYIAKRLNDQRTLAQEEIKSTKELEKQQALMERLQKASNARVTKAQGTFQQAGQLSYLQGSGASNYSVQASQLQTIVGKTQAAYDKLVERTRQGLFNAKDATEVAKINAEFDKTSARLTNLSTKYNTLLGTVEKLAGAHKPLIERIFDFVVGYRLINAALNTFTNAIRSVPEAGLQFETTYASLKAVYSVTAKVNAELKFLDRLAQDAGIAVGDLRTSFTDFAASAKFSGEEAKNIEEIFSNISKAGMVLHLPADRMKSAFTAINQMYAKNQVMMEELKRQLGNQLPAAVNIFALSMGKTTRQLMDDMKKGLVLPKETILEFSRTYASIFASPDAVEYASQGVNAYFQRLSTAWTNFSTKIYETSKGGIKLGLGLMTEALKFATENAEKLKDATILLGTVIGISMVQHLAKATMAWVAYRNSVVAATSVSLAGSALNAKNMTSVMAGGTATAATTGVGASLATFAKNTWAVIPPWVKLIGLIGGAVIALKDLEVSSVKVMSSMDRVDGKAVEVSQSVTVTDVALASWDLLIEKIQRALDLKSEQEAKKTGAPSSMDTFMESWKIYKDWWAKNSSTSPVVTNFFKESTAKADQQKILDNAAAEAKRNSERVTEQVKETLLQGTSGVVTETVESVSKAVSAALQQIEAEFNITKQRIQGSTNIEVAKLESQIVAIQNKEKLGLVTKLEATARIGKLQEQIQQKQLEADKRELKALEDKLEKTKAISDAQVYNSDPYKAYEASNLKLGTMYRFREEMSKMLPQVAPDTFKTSEEALKALQTGSIAQNKELLDKAFLEFNATHLQTGFKSIMTVTDEAMAKAQEETKKAWEGAEQIARDHMEVTNRVANGMDIQNTEATKQTSLLQELVNNAFKPDLQLSEDIGVSAGATISAAITPKIDSIVAQASAKFGVDENLIKAVIAKESAGRVGAVSPKGAGGLMQLMPDTARGLGVTDRFDPYQNIMGGTKLLAQELAYFNGDLRKSLAAYNAGRGAVLRYGGVPPYAETKEYVADISAKYRASKASMKAGIPRTETAATAAQTAVEQQLDTLQVKELKLRDTQSVNAAEQLVLALQTNKENLQSLYNLTKTERDKALSQLDQTAIPLTDAQRQDRTTAINKQYLPQLTKELDDLAANLKEESLRTIETSKKNAISEELINLAKERQTLMTDIAKGEFEAGLRKVLPMQDALERKHFEVKKQLQDTLGIYDEKLAKQEQDLRNEELIKFIYTEQAKLKDTSLGYSKEEIANREKLLNQLTEYQNKLNQIDLINAKIAKDSAYSEALQNASQAAGANTQAGIAAQAGLSGRFMGAMVTEAAASKKYPEKMAAFQTEMANFKAAQAKVPTGTTEWENLQAKIEATTTKMNELKLAKNAVFVQAGQETIDSISNAFLDWANGAKTASEAMRGVAIDFIKMIQEILMQEVKVQIVSGFLSLLGIGTGIGGGGFAAGGLVKGFASGGQVNGKGTGISDSNYAVVPNGSYVLNAQATHQAKQGNLIKVSHGEVILSPEQVAQIGVEKLNKINARGYASGGLVGTNVSTTKPANVGSSNVTNINVSVPEGTSNAKQFGQEVGVEIMKAIAKQEAAKQVNLYAKRASNR